MGPQWALQHLITDVVLAGDATTAGRPAVAAATPYHFHGEQQSPGSPDWVLNKLWLKHALSVSHVSPTNLGEDQFQPQRGRLGGGAAATKSGRSSPKVSDLVTSF